jgi:hypothetical protein
MILHNYERTRERSTDTNGKLKIIQKSNLLQADSRQRHSLLETKACSLIRKLLQTFMQRSPIRCYDNPILGNFRAVTQCYKTDLCIEGEIQRRISFHWQR